MRSTRVIALAAMTGLALLSLTGLAAANPAAPAPTDATTGSVAAGGAVVNEFAPSLPVWPLNEFVELRNTSEQTVALGGWKLVACLSPTTRQVAVRFPAGAEIPPGGYLLLAHPDWESPFGPTPDYFYDVEVPEDGGWLLHDPWTGHTDGVGLDRDLACTEGDPAPRCDWATAGEAVTRGAQGKDTEDNAADFTCQHRTPGW